MRHARLRTTWNDVFRAISPSMMHEGSDSQLQTRLGTFVQEADPEVVQSVISQFDRAHDIRLTSNSFETIMIQLRALGLITQSERPQRSVKDSQMYWTLTPYGDSVMMRLRAVRRRGISLSPHDAIDGEEERSVVKADRGPTSLALEPSF